MNIYAFLNVGEDNSKPTSKPVSYNTSETGPP